MNKDYCVYVHINKLTNEIFYVGSGYLNRPYNLKKWSRNKKWQAVLENIGPNNIQVEIKEYFTTREDAVDFETSLSLELIDLGYNLCIEKIGNKLSENMKLKISKSNMGKISPRKNVKLSEETKKKISSKRIESECAKGKNNPQYGLRGELSPRYGKHHSDEVKRKISEGNKKRYKEGRVSVLKGKTHTDEAKAKISASKIGKARSEDVKRKLSEAKTQKIGYFCEELKLFFRNEQEFKKLQDSIPALKGSFATIRRNATVDKKPYYSPKYNLTFVAVLKGEKI